MEEKKKYLSLGRKIAYGTGDFGSNFFYMMISSFVMIYLTDSVGLNAGIIGTLIMVSKLLDGITDVFFGRLIDITHSKMGKARPWMFYSAFPLALCLILIFMVPTGMAQTMQYVYFFILYTCANALFYTANNISYATMSALITKNDTERVSLGSFRYIFAVVAAIIVSSITVVGVQGFGGGAAGWRNMAVIYAIVLIVFNSIASLVCKEIPLSEEDHRDQKIHNEKNNSLWKMFQIIFSNKYYLLMLAIYILTYTMSNIGSGIGVYYFQYVMGNAALLGVISLSAFIMIVGLIANPILVKKYGMYKVNLVSYMLTVVISIGVMLFSFTENFVGILICYFLRAIATAPLMGSLNALVAEVAQNTFLKKNVHAEGMMFSCSSIGLKLGSGLGAGLVGWLLASAGYVGNVAVQSTTVLFMIKFVFGAVPLILAVLVVLCLFGMKVVEENKLLSSK